MLWVGRNIERAYSTYNYSQIRVADGSFVRLKHVSLGYRVSEAFAKKLRLQSAKLQLSLTNPLPHLLRQNVYVDRTLNIIVQVGYLYPHLDSTHSRYR